MTLLLLCCFSWTKEAKASVPFSGVFTSSSIYAGGLLDTIDWNETVPDGTSVSMRVRAGDIATPDGTWTAWSSVSKEGSLASFAGKEYVQYEATLSGDGSAEPSLSDVTFVLTGDYLLSSPYNSEDSTLEINSLVWQESLSGTADVRFQIRTSANGTAWTAWCGPDNGGTGCDSSTYFTDPSGAESVDQDFRDGSDDNYVQYKAVLSSDGINLPIISGVTINYVVDETHTRTYFGIFTSSVIDAGAAANFTTIDWNGNVPSGTSLSMRLRAGNTVTPDGTWTAWSSFTKGGSLDTLDGKRYIQYETNLSSDGSLEPALNDIMIGILTEGYLISSPYETETDNAALSKISWTETLPDATTDVRFQLSTSANGTDWTAWCGPDNGGAGCSSSTYFTNSGGSETIDNELTDGVDDQYIRYKVFLSSSSDSNPIVSGVSMEYLTNIIQFGSAASSGSESTTSANIAMSLNKSWSSDVTVDYAVTGGTATPNVDFILPNGTATIHGGETSGSIPITIINDGSYELSKTIEITLSNPTNATLGTNTIHTYTIIEDDSLGGVIFVPPSRPDIKNVKIDIMAGGGLILENIPDSVIQMAISSSSSFDGLAWEDISKQSEIMDRYKNSSDLYIKFRSREGGVSDVFSWERNDNVVSTLAEGAIVKTTASPDVYIIKYKNGKQYKRLILSPNVFNSYQHLKWGNIKIISQTEMDRYTASNLVKETADTIIYELFPNGDTGQRKIFEISKSYDADSVYEINRVDRDSYILVK